MKRVFVSGVFDDPRSPQLRFLHEASRIGPVTLLLWPDAKAAALRGSASGMSLEERVHYFEALRYVDVVEALPVDFDPDRPGFLKKGAPGAREAVWALYPAEEGGPEAANARKLAWCRSRGIRPRQIHADLRAGFPYAPPSITSARAIGRKRVVATGGYELVGSEGLRFLEAASELGELNVVIESDARLRPRRGEERSSASEEERRYVVGSFRCVMRCILSSGQGPLGAEPELRALKPDRHVVDEGQDDAETRRYCGEKGIEYIVLKR